MAYPSHHPFSQLCMSIVISGGLLILMIVVLIMALLYIIVLTPNLISWSSRKYKIVARSSTEAEYRALVFAALEVSWITSLLNKLRLPCPRSPFVLCDNISFIYFTANPIFHLNRSILKLTISLFEKRLVRASSLFDTFLLLIKLLMYLLKL